MSGTGRTPQNQYAILRVALASAIALAVASYTVAIVAGKLAQERRIDAVHFGIIVLAGFIVLLLLKPNIADRLKRFEGAGFKLEMLEKVKEKQDEQAHVLDDISLILPLLLPKTERKHLINLDRRSTEDYKGNSAFRSEIRRLRSIGLLEMLPGCHVGQMKSGMKFDLADYVRLTELGHRWVTRIKQIDEQERETEEHDDES